jgi:hypothetical protein
MRKSVFIVLFSALGATIFMSNEGGAAANFPGDRTGRVTATNTCRGCHTGAAYGSVTVTQAMTDAGGNPVTAYIGGMTYTITLTINKTQGTPAGYGFQWVSVKQSDNATQAGIPTTTQTRTAVHTLSGRSYVEQTAALSTNVVTFTWVAPAAGAGAIKIVFVGMAIDGSGTSGNTDTVSPSTTVVLAETVATERITTPTSSLKILPNPVIDILHTQINTLKSGNYTLQVMDLSGRILTTQDATLVSGDNILSLDVRNLAAGLYAIRLLGANSVEATATMVKR